MDVLIWFVSGELMVLDIDDLECLNVFMVCMVEYYVVCIKFFDEFFMDVICVGIR